MTIELPPGFISRHKASQRYNRSQRQLERDLQKARIVNDTDVLDHYIIVTNDGTRRHPNDITPEEVQKEVNDGKGCTWGVEQSYLERTFGRKGSPKPEPPQPAQHHTPKQPPSDQTPPKRTSDPLPPNDPDLTRTAEPIPFEVIFDHPYVRELRHQVHIKDDQIKGWNKLTDQFQRLQVLAQQKGVLFETTTNQNTPNDSSPKFIEGDFKQESVDASHAHQQFKPRNKIVNQFKPSSRKKSSKRRSRSRRKKTAVQVREIKLPKTATENVAPKQTFWSRFRRRNK